MRSRASGRLFRKAWTLGRQPHGAFGGLREEENVPLPDVQKSERLSRDEYPEGVTDTADLQFQSHVISIGITDGVVNEKGCGGDFVASAQSLVWPSGGFAYASRLAGLRVCECRAQPEKSGEA